jgi:hypothetical protein
MAGAGLAFLWFNAHPAQVFMGDVGALALGGALGTIAVIVRQEIVLAIMGGIFVVEALSVMLQVAGSSTPSAATARAGASSRWRRCTTTSRRRLGRDAGRGALLDHHHAAVPGGPVQPQAAVMTMPTCKTSPCLSSAWATPAWPWRAGAQAPRRRVRVADTREARRNAALRRRTCRAGALRWRRAGRPGLADWPPVQLARCKSPGLAPHDAGRQRVAPLPGPARRRPGIAGAGRAGPVRPALADLKAQQWLRAAGAGHHRHQRQDHGDHADRAAGRACRACACRQERGRGRQHRPDAAGHAWRARADLPRDPARRCGCWSCRASSSTA